MTDATRSPEWTDELWTQHLAWIRSLALRLARDESAAEDLVQRTALVALQRGGAANAARPGVRAWLGGILRNEARSGWRRERNRRAREAERAAASGNDDPGPHDRTLDLSKRIVELIERLPDEQRRAVVARYAHDAPLPQIAAEEGITVRAVESRLRRARAKLRDELNASDPRAAGGQPAWAALVLTRWRGEGLGLPAHASAAETAALKSSAAQTGSAVAGSTSTPILVSLLAMKTKLLALAAVVTLALVATWLQRTTTGQAPDLDRSSDARAELAELGRTPEEPSAPPESQAARTAAAEPAVAAPEPAARGWSLGAQIQPLPSGTLEIWIVDEQGIPIDGAEVLISNASGIFRSYGPPVVPEDAARKVERVPFGSREPIRFDGLELGTWFVRATAPGGSIRDRSLKLVKACGTTCVVSFGSATIHGEVTFGNRARTPMAGANLIITTAEPAIDLTQDQLASLEPVHASLSTKGSAYAVTDELGGYSFAGLSRGVHRVWLDGNVWNEELRETHRVPDSYRQIELEAGETRRVDFPPRVEDGDFAIFRGHVVDEAGRPVVTTDFWRRAAELRVKSVATTKSAGFDMDFHDPRDRLVTEVGKYNADGSFELVLPPGTYDVSISSPHLDELMDVIQDGGLVLAKGQTVERNLTLPGITLRATLDPSYEEHLTKRVRGTKENDYKRTAGARLSHVTYSSGILHGGIDESGLATFYGLEPGDWIVTALKNGARAEFPISDGQREVSITLLPR